MMDKELFEELIQEIRFVLIGMIESEHFDQYQRLIWYINNNFESNFPPSNKRWFILCHGENSLKYYAFASKKQAEIELGKLRKLEAEIPYRLVNRTVAEMIGLEFEFYQYQEMIVARTDEEAKRFRQKQQEIIDSLFFTK